MSRRLVVLSHPTPRAWHSLNVIEDAITRALAAQTDTVFLEMPITPGPQDFQRVEAAAAGKPAAIYYLADDLRLEEYVNALARIPNIIHLIPVYGNMTIETRRWFRLHETLRGLPTVLLGASHRQCQQLESFTEGASIKCLPYPVAKEFFQAPTEADDGTVRIVYAGRITPQKNVLELMSAFNQAAALDPRLELHLAGDFHDRGYHMHGLGISPLDYRERFRALVEAAGGRIQYHGFLGQAELAQLFRRCDVTASLSTYHDEDFGVSVAQAMAAGLPALLSDWGGHGGFREAGEVRLIPVTVDGQQIPRPSVKAFLAELLSLPGPTSNHRKAMNQERARTLFSTEAFLVRMRAILTSPALSYQGQTPLFLRFAEICEVEAPFHPLLAEKWRGLVPYKNVYRPYLCDYEPGEKYLP